MHPGFAPNFNFEGMLICNLEHIETYFSEFGEIKEIIFGRDKNSGRRLGFCILEFQHEKAVARTLEVEDHQINGKSIKVQEMLLRHELKEKKKPKYPKSQKTHSNYYTNYETTHSSSFKGRSEGRSYQNSHDGYWKKGGNRQRKKKYKNYRGRGYGYNSNNSEKRSQGSGFRSKRNGKPGRKELEMRSDWKRDEVDPSIQVYFHNSLPSQGPQEYVRKETSKTDERITKAAMNKNRFATLTNPSESCGARGKDGFQRFDSLVPPQKQEIRLQRHHDEQHQDDFIRSNTTKNFLDKEMKTCLTGHPSKFDTTDMVRSNTISGQQALFNLGSLRRQETWKNQFRPVQLGFDGVDSSTFNRYGQGEQYAQTPPGNYQQNSNLQRESKFTELGLNNQRGEGLIFDASHQQGPFNPSISIPKNPMMRLGTLRSHNQETGNQSLEFSRFNTLPTIPSEKLPDHKEEVSFKAKDLFKPSYQNLGMFLNDDTPSKDQAQDSDYEGDDQSSLSQVSDNLNIEN